MNRAARRRLERAKAKASPAAEALAQAALADERRALAARAARSGLVLASPHLHTPADTPRPGVG